MANAAALTALGVLNPSGPGTFALVILLAVAMGVQNATARRLAVPDLTTTVLTLTLTGLAADSSLGGGSNPRPLRRVAAVVALLAGTALLFHVGLAATLGVLTAVLASSTAGFAASAPSARAR